MHSCISRIFSPWTSLKRNQSMWLYKKLIQAYFLIVCTPNTQVERQNIIANLSIHILSSSVLQIWKNAKLAVLITICHLKGWPVLIAELLSCWLMNSIMATARQLNIAIWETKGNISFKELNRNFNLHSGVVKWHETG